MDFNQEDNETGAQTGSGGPTDATPEETTATDATPETVAEPVAAAPAAATEGEEIDPTKRKKSTRPDLKWYIVHSQTSFEARAKASLEEAIVRAKKEDEFGEVLIPVESVVELVKGQKKSTERKFFPGYMLVQMILTDENWHIVKSTPRITGFVGNARKPPSIPPKEVERIMGQMVEGRQQAKPKYTFKEGDSVRVIDGPFANFNGQVEEVKPEKSKLRVLVSIFGRATPVELDFIQVEKT